VSRAILEEARMTPTNPADDVLILTEPVISARERLGAVPKPRFGWPHFVGALVGAALGIGLAMAVDALTDEAPPPAAKVRAAVEPALDRLLREARKAALEHRFGDAERLIGEAETRGGAALPALDDAKRFLDIVRSRIDFG
jgi:hypothetical protein